MKRRKPDPSKVRQKAVERLSKLPSADVAAWGDTCLAGTWRAFEDLMRTGSPDSLAEVRQGLETLSGVVDVLESRQS